MTLIDALLVNTGASLVLATVRLKASVILAVPSEAVTVISKSAAAVGVPEKVCVSASKLSHEGRSSPLV